jgi:hypothetical protein
VDHEFFFLTPRFFFIPQQSYFTPQTSVNANRIFENFGFYLPKFSDIEKQVFQPFIFQKTQTKSENIFRIFQKKTKGVKKETWGVGKQSSWTINMMKHILAQKLVIPIKTNSFDEPNFD